jgi:integrase
MAKLYGKGRIVEIERGKKYRLELSGGKHPITGQYMRARETFLGTKRQAELRVEEMRKELELTRELLEIGLGEDDLLECGISVPMALQDGMNAIRVRHYVDEYRDKRRREVTFADWCEKYLATREELGSKRANTYKADRCYSKHLVSGLGDLVLSDIRPSTVSDLYATMKSNGVGASTINQCHKLLKRIMHAAMVDELINRNPVELVETPKKPKPKRRALTVEQAARIRDLTSSGTLTGNKVAVYLGLALGARVGEVLGLQWRHIELDGPTPCVHIVQQYVGGGKVGPLKTDDDNNPVGRLVPIDSATSRMLKAWRVEQRNKLINEVGVEPGNDTPVITNEVGGYCDRRNFSAWFRSWCVDHGFGKWIGDDGRQIVELTVGDDPSLYGDATILWRDSEGWPCDASGKRYSRTYKRPTIKRHYDGLVYHELRHSHFTLRLASGTSIPVAQALGGWSTPAMLTEVYLHSTPEGIWDEAGFMDEVIGASRT